MGKKKTKRRSKSRSGSIDQAIAAADTTNDTNLTTSPKLTPQSSTPSSPSKEKYPLKIDEEDLSTQRHDEETVLTAIYGNDFTLESGAWNCPLYKLRIRPASDVTDHGQISTADLSNHAHNPNNNAENNIQSCEVTLQIQLNQKYPYSVPLIQITNVSGVSTNQISELLSLLQVKASECAEVGQVMGWELGQVIEAYLVDCVDKRKRDDRKRLEDMQMKDHTNDDSFEFDASRFDDEDVGYDRSNTPVDEHAVVNIMDSDTQKEVARQIEALDNAAQLRKQRRQRARGGILPSIADKQDEEDDEEDDNFLQLPDGYDIDLAPAAFVTTQDGDAAEQNTSSRYQTDFVEIAHLGKGGGGEVVQAINRLDRRVYAIKKVLLEGATIQNEKLRREVTTISMMSHKNIVRYYQAWVERGDQEEEVDDDKPTSTKEKEETTGDNNIPISKEEDDNNEDRSSSSWNSWSSSSESSVDSQESTSVNEKIKQKNTDYARSLSLDNFLEHEVGLDAANPLFGNGTLLGYPPLATSKSSSLLPTHNEQRPSKSYSTSDWQTCDLNSRQRQRRQSNGIMYIQMQYCKTTMRDMIDDSKLSLDIVWKSLRQILEALVYIHSRNVIHRDLKPANIFIDDEENIRLGDFGLATSNQTTNSEEITNPESEAEVLYEAIDDISGLLGTSSSAANLSNPPSSRSITGGVGTTFYMAPEQEHSKLSKFKTSYDSKADMYSLGVLLFEMFLLRPIGCTYMERAEMLTTLKGGPRGVVPDKDGTPLFTATGDIVGDWNQASEQRLPKSFRDSVPINAQKIILWCLERSPKNRPSAKQLLESDLLPRKVELEKRYLNEVLQTLSNPQSEDSYYQILSKMFARPTSSAVLITYDNEISIRASKIDAQHLLATSLATVKGSQWSRLSYTNPMSSVSVAAAVSALQRARNVGTVSGGGREGEILRGVPQQVATVLAQTAAAAAGIEGFNGVLGADPRVVQAMCRKLSDIFQSHGAVRLQGPLLRPKEANELDSTSFNKPVEVLGKRGCVLTMKEDLVVNFARAVARGGSATSNMKRFDINKVYIESEAGLHPKEMLEASFDIIQDENIAKAELLEAESILVLCQTMSLLTPKEAKSYELPPIVLHSPVWYLRLTHTRLSDAIMDLMFLPTSDVIRQCCLNLFSSLTACQPSELTNQRRQTGKHKRKARELKAERMTLIDTSLEAASISEILPKQSIKRLRVFFSYFVMPHLEANKVLDIIYEACRKIHNADISSNNSEEVKRLSKSSLNEIIRCIMKLRQLLKAMEALGVVTSTTKQRKKDDQQQPHINNNKNISYPAYISIDIGLRQKRGNFSGGTFYQAILILNNAFFEDGDDKANGKGIRVAEGGRYDDLVRHFRPPSNFGSIQVSNYSAVKIPFCSGLIMFVGKMMEVLYTNALTDETWQGHQLSFIESLRRSIKHPLIDQTVQCIVTSENGLDLATCPERAAIASMLWKCGVSCEYLAQSSVILSLLRHIQSSTSTSPEWVSSADKVSGICAILNIPYVVVVQPHLLKSKTSVRLRHIISSTSSGPVYDGSEEVVPLSSLPSLLLDRLGSLGSDSKDDVHLDHSHHHQASNGDSSSLQIQPHGTIVDMECIYVSTDQYFDNEHRVNNTQWKSIKKIMRTSSQNVSSYISDIINQQNAPVVAIDLPFRVVRDLGSSLTFDGIECLNGSSEIISKYPQYKKILRNLMYALDALVQKKSQGSGDSDKRGELNLFLYSTVDDKYDLITLECRDG